ncbi:nitrile hydratase subunit beta [Paraburkholderia saeva]|uniref:Nitrile hydratase subunit beta n=1 Tax=Paraburkholderia saeva TaxID=2777537 RepID=A0A9N8S1G1_9BURK|nr:nitrile hydratase subunit beta [Paraburkholderia saeva]CAG4889494.1 Low-molecular weight cobalt-containing nitrile hydratase subunit beta [Paraburkholderia saeva]CAG4894762.1 Low-molecular weight cobalt-containing nitrile hydratase subunit beta [Paraburkholderia saeva]CAG4918141.1 Low-molecular weight cobalt-containing nitrile hydratase subunit beta [Paraburkholderia saeva]
MNGAQDLGGMQAFGPVQPEAEDAPLFHAAWERRVFAITLAMGATGKWNIDTSRAARESLPPAQYLASSYYEIWFEGLRKLLHGSGLASAGELESGTLQISAAPVPRVLTADQVKAALLRGSPVNRPVTHDARFQVGDAVRTCKMNPSTHTRLPRYCRDKRGTIVALRGVHVFPDTNASGRGENPEWLYTVRFDAAELWGADTTASSVCVDCWEPYLDIDANDANRHATH